MNPEYMPPAVGITVAVVLWVVWICIVIHGWKRSGK